MSKEVVCPWCEKSTLPRESSMKSDYTDHVKVRECSECGSILAAYAESEGDFFPGIRVFRQ